jgi:hypothetical protein
MTSVATNGSCVTTIRKIKPGSRGARRTHRSLLDKAWALADGEESRPACWPDGARAVETSVVISSLL